MLPKILRALSTIALVAAASSFVTPASLVAQATSSLVTTRLTQAINENSRVTLKGTVYPLANAANDRGAAPDSMPLSRLTLVLKRSDAQESALKKLIGDMHTPGSASYHKWLTPDEFGKQFGPSDQDLATVEAWLQSHGFGITRVNPGRQSIEISGNVSQFRNTFHAQIRKYMVNGETHYANASDPQIPTALAPVVGGFASLNNFRPRSPMRLLGHALWNPQTHQATPQWTYPVGTGENFAIAPGDFAVQYDVPNSTLNPGYTGTTYDGTGQTIAIVNESNINIAAVNAFRTTFGLPANPPQVIIDGNDPGIDGINNPDGPNYASGEAYLDVEWSGAVAPGAQVDLVIAADTALESGLYLAMQHAVYANVAPIISLSFLGCELAQGTSGNAFISQLWEQAAAQGITVMVSSGDGGSAGCDNFNSQQYAVQGLAVNGLSSTPYNVSVGGTDFYYSNYQNATALDTQLSTYWNRTATNSPTTSLKSRIPEQPWNDSQFGLDAINYYSEKGSTLIVGGGGGVSTVYNKPSWQTGTGVPADSHRDIPDVSLFAADGLNYSYYAFCGGADGDCQGSSNGNPVQISGAGGTSISSPAFAGIMALINQKYGRQGQADFVLYPLAAQFPAVFHDVTVGTNSVPCNFNTTSAGAPPVNCISVTNPITITDSTYGTAIEGQLGTGTTPDYNAVAGYDLATGLGSVDASLLLTNWGNVHFASTSTTLTASSTTFTHGTSITISGAVTPGTATGSVALETDSTEPVQQGQGFPQTFNGTAGTFTLSNGSYTGPVNYLPGGTYNIWGQYSGDGSNAASTSEKTQITVSPEASTTALNIFDVGTGYGGGTPISSGATNVPYGSQLILSAQPVPTTYYNQCLVPATPPASCSTATYTFPTGTVAFADNGTTINTAVLNNEGDAEYNAPWTIGSHSVTAKYSGDNSYNASNASAFTFTIAKNTPQINPFTTITTQSGALVGGQSIVLTIQVLNTANLVNEQQFGAYSNPALTPTGTVTISGLPSGVPTSATLYAGVDAQTLSPAGIATITIPSSVSAKTYNVTINYPGDTNYNSATTGSFPLTIQSVGGLATMTTASLSGTISPATNVTLTGTVTGQSGHAAPSNDNGNGGVLIYSSGYVLSQVSVVPGTGDTSTFSATLNSQKLLQGSNAITVQYLGDNTYAPSAFTITNPLNNPLSDFSMVPETTIVPVTAGNSGTDIINVSSVNTFAGSVSFTCTPASGISCTITPAATLTSGSNSALTLTINASASAANKNYNVLVTGKDAAGLFVHTLAIEAVVSGGSTTPGFSLSAAPSSLNLVAGASAGNTSVVTAMPANGFTGAINLSCSVAGPSGATSPATCSLSSSSVDVTSGAATSTVTVASTSTTTAGAYTVTVTGTGSGAAGSAPITETATINVAVTAPTFALSANPNSGSITAGSSATTTISVAPSGFTGSVALTCAVTGSGTGVTCTLSPTSVSISGTTAGTSMLTIATSSNSAALSRPLNKFFAIGGGATLAMLFFFGIPARRRSWRAILGMLILGAIVGVGIGCGSSGGGNNGGGSSANYTVTVTGTSGSLTSSANVAITVNSQ